MTTFGQLQPSSSVWAGRRVVCIASGPSLTESDCKLVEQSGLTTVAVNNVWEVARFCHAIYAGDEAWWDLHKDRIDVTAELWTCSQRAARKHHISHHQAAGGYNSGLRAIEFAAAQGAKSIVMLGYDCMLTGKRSHYHGDHVGLGNPSVQRCRMWEAQFIRLAAQLKPLEILNASRQTALRCFPRKQLEDVLLTP